MALRRLRQGQLSLRRRLRASGLPATAVPKRRVGGMGLTGTTVTLPKKKVLGSRVFAVRICKNWIELRQGTVPPTAESTKCEHKFMYTPTPHEEAFGVRGGERKVTFAVTCFDGGKVLGAIQTRTFQSLCLRNGMLCPTSSNPMVELPKDFAKLMLSAEWRREHHVR